MVCYDMFMLFVEGKLGRDLGEWRMVTIRYGPSQKQNGYVKMIISEFLLRYSTVWPGLALLN